MHSRLFLISGQFLVLIMTVLGLCSCSGDPSNEEYVSQLWCKYRCEGYTALLDKDYPSAERSYQAALDQCERSKRNKNRLCLSICDLADLYCEQERYDEAMLLYKKAIAIGSDDSSQVTDLAIFNALSGLGLCDMRKPTGETLQSLQKACHVYSEFSRKLKSGSPPATMSQRYVRCLLAIADYHIHDNNIQKAEQPLDEAKEIAENAPLSYDFRTQISEKYDKVIKSIYTPR